VIGFLSIHGLCDRFSLNLKSSSIVFPRTHFLTLIGDRFSPQTAWMSLRSISRFDPGFDHECQPHHRGMQDSHRFQSGPRDWSHDCFTSSDPQKTVTDLPMRMYFASGRYFPRPRCDPTLTFVRGVRAGSDFEPIPFEIGWFTKRFVSVNLWLRTMNGLDSHSRIRECIHRIPTRTL
jgi:hypothetical protein